MQLINESELKRIFTGTTGVYGAKLRLRTVDLQNEPFNMGPGDSDQSESKGKSGGEEPEVCSFC